jgi:thiol-disulfide isomerase/thioredoxin
MRLIVAVVVGFGLLSFTSCSETQQKPQVSRVADNAPTLSQSESLEMSEVHSSGDVHGKHRKVVGQQGSSRETGDDHKNHGETHPEHRRDGHSTKDRMAGHNTKKIAVGEKVPDFEITIDGKKWKLSELQKNSALTKDGTIVLTFWCSFCHSCRHVEHRLDKLAKQYKGKAGVIALDASAGETADGVAEFATERGLTLPIALNPSGAAAEIFGTRVTTTTVVIDSKGVLRYCGQFGDNQHAFAEDALKAVLAGEEVHVKKTRHKG